MKIKISILISFTLSLALASNALAMPKGDFPNKFPLQPLTEGVRPNISGNINSTSTNYQNIRITDMEDDYDTSETDSATKPERPLEQNESKNENSSPNILKLFIIFILGISIFIFWGYRRLE